MFRRREMMISANSEPKIAMTGAYLGRHNTDTVVDNNYVYTEWYAVDYLAGVHNIRSNTTDATHTYQYSFTNNTANWYYKDQNIGNATNILEFIRFSIPISMLDTGYAYDYITGQIFFAGKQTPYYGYKNINYIPVSHIKFNYNIDGLIHDSTITLPLTNFSLLVKLGPTETVGNLCYLDTSTTDNTNRYLQLGFYNDYAYFDVGGIRTSFQVASGYDRTKTNYFSAAVNSNKVYNKYINSYKASGACNTYEVANFGTLRGNRDKSIVNNKVTIYFYNQELSDYQLRLFATTGYVP